MKNCLVLLIYPQNLSLYHVHVVINTADTHHHGHVDHATIITSCRCSAVKLLPSSGYFYFEDTLVSNENNKS